MITIENRINNSTIDWNSGPDKLCPADSYYSSKLDQPVKLRSNQNDLNKYPSLSIYTMFKQVVDKRPQHKALAFKHRHRWSYVTYEEYWKNCQKSAKSFIKLGLEKSNCVTIIGFNCPQWCYSFIGAIFAGGVANGIHSTNSVEIYEHILKDSKSQIVILESEDILNKIIKCIDKVSLKTIVQYTGKIEDNYDGLVITWSEFLDCGNSITDEALDKKIKSLAPNKCASLVYTPGTMGPTKGTMISHDSITFLSRYFSKNIMQLDNFKERLISFMPLSHMTAQLIDIFVMLNIGATVYFADKDAAKGSLISTILDVKPTIIYGVPQIWEKIQEKIKKIIRNIPYSHSRFIDWVKSVSFEYMQSIFNKSSCQFSIQYELAKIIILNEIYEHMGLNECKCFLNSDVPITKEMLEFFLSFGISLTEFYGMCETTGLHSCGTIKANRLASVGPVDQMNLSKIINKDKSDDSGELCIFGRHIFMGYLNDEQKTKESFDNDGWLHTGDLAKIDNDGYIYITGRINELIFSSKGDKIIPSTIENIVKYELPFLVSNCVLVCEKKNYLSLLITLKSKIDPETLEPTDELAERLAHYIDLFGSKSTKVSDIIGKKDEIVYKEIEKGLKKVNKYPTNCQVKILKFAILPRDFSFVNGELSSTLKLRRYIITQMYSSLIEELFSDNYEDDV